MRTCLIASKALLEMKEGVALGGEAWGRAADNGDVVQVLSTNETTGLSPIGQWRRAKAETPAGVNRSSGLTIEVSAVEDDGQSAIVEAYDGSGKFEVKVVDIGRAFNRVKDILQMDRLASRRVLVAGVGSGGSRVALELAKAGVDTMVLVDNEQVEIENVARHVCGFSDIGRFKTKAVRDLILNHNPTAKVTCHEFDISTDMDRFESLVSEADLVIAATGSPKLNDITNALCVRNAVPAVFAGVWEKACGGYAMRYIPGETPCYSCVHQIVSELQPRPSKSIDYSSIDDITQLKAEPGISIDIGFIPLLQSKLALMTLLRGNYGDDIQQSLLVWLNRSEGRYPALSLLKASAQKRPDCIVCGSQGGASKQPQA